MDFRKELVIKGYSQDHIIDKYTQIGLWESESILINKYFKGCIRILDIGCGAGRTSIPLALKGFEVKAIDITPSMIEKARELSGDYFPGNLSWQVMDCQKLEFMDQRFDGVLFSFNGIEHIPGIQGKKQVIEEIHRVLKKNGVFILTAHSGLPFNRWGLRWLKRAIQYYIRRIFAKNVLERHFGERYYNYSVPESLYAHVISIFRLKRLLVKGKFKILYFNSSKRIEQKKASTLWTHFLYDNLFLVVRKS
ncbi:MAG: hypothetical protein IEMM0008_1224 [bacterium]|nr:MAG: hypothetical protein IEMM0008_1224 [bacterium]